MRIVCTSNFSNLECGQFSRFHLQNTSVFSAHKNLIISTVCVYHSCVFWLAHIYAEALNYYQSVEPKIWLNQFFAFTLWYFQSPWYCFTSVLLLSFVHIIAKLSRFPFPLKIKAFRTILPCLNLQNNLTPVHSFILVCNSRILSWNVHKE